MRQYRNLSEQHRKRISQAMKAYWEAIPYAPRETNVKGKKEESNEIQHQH